MRVTPTALLLALLLAAGCAAPREASPPMSVPPPTSEPPATADRAEALPDTAAPAFDLPPLDAAPLPPPASPAGGLVPVQIPLFPQLTGDVLLDSLRAWFTPQRVLPYDQARDLLFASLHNEGGYVRDLHTALAVEVDPEAPSPGVVAERQGLRAARLRLATGGVPETSEEASQVDLHVLFPVWADVGAGAWAEPHEDYVGDAARALFYAHTVYGTADAEAFEVRREALLAWHREDPADVREALRSLTAAAYQDGRVNPFVFDSTLARRAFVRLPPPPVWINEIHYDNEGGDTEEGVELAGPAGTDLGGWTIQPYNGNGSRTYGAVPVPRVPIPDQRAGFGAVWVPIDRLQNGSPDGVALVAPNGAVVQFLSYEGTLVAAGGPADGMQSTDIGEQEGGSSPLGHSLQLVGVGRDYDDFAWSAPAEHSRGQLNGGQTFVEAP